MRKLKLEELNRMDVEKFREVDKIPLVVVLDNVRSMYNVGSVFRTSDAFLVEKIWLTGITGRPPHREITKTALGSTESVSWEYEKQVAQVVKNLRNEGFTIVGIEQTDQSLDIEKFQPQKGVKYALILGNEVDGISDAIIDELDMALEIPQFGTKHSLNISVAAGIAIWELGRKMIREN